jgi:hypothetical protein
VLTPKHAYFFGNIYLARRQISLKHADNWPLLPFLVLLKGNTLGYKKEEEKRPSFWGSFSPKKESVLGKATKHMGKKRSNEDQTGMARST